MVDIDARRTQLIVNLVKKERGASGVRAKESLKLGTARSSRRK